MEKLKKFFKNTVAVIVMISLLVIVFYQNRDRDFLKFGKAESEQTDQEFQKADDISIGSQNTDICRVGDNIVHISPTALTTVNKNGNKEIENIAITSPVIHSEDDFLLYYSDGDKEINVYKGKKAYYTITPENRIIRAKVNRNGYSLVVTEKEGYSSEATVYNRSGEAIFRWSLSKSEFLDGDINADNNKIVISAIDAEEKVMQGKMMLIDITDAKVEEEQIFESDIFYTVDFNRNGTYVATGSSYLAYFNANGTLKWKRDYDGRTLLKKDFTQPDVLVLAFSAAGSGIRGNSTEVEVINRLGEVVASRTINSIADDISVSGQKIAIAFGKKLHITDSFLEEEKIYEAESSIKKTEFFAGGKHLFILGNSSEEIIDV